MKAPSKMKGSGKKAFSSLFSCKLVGLGEAKRPSRAVLFRNKRAALVRASMNQSEFSLCEEQRPFLCREKTVQITTSSMAPCGRGIYYVQVCAVGCGIIQGPGMVICRTRL